MSVWTTAAPAVVAAFTASAVEVVEAFTLVLVAATLRGWRPALGGAAIGLLALMVLALGPALQLIPIHALQLVVGVLLLLFGLGWLRKAVLRAGGVLALHDEAAIFAREQARVRALCKRAERAADGVAALGAFKGVLLEGLEVVFIVIAVGAEGPGLTAWAALGASGACVIVIGAGLLVRRPMTRVPENALKFVVGVMLSSFGVFWTGEGLGVSWPGDDLALPAFATTFLAVGLGLARLIRRQAPPITAQGAA